MKFRLEIDMGNSAMSSADAVAGALAGVTDFLIANPAEDQSGVIRDANGNVVGHWVFGE